MTAIYHKHRCPSCYCVWAHDEKAVIDPRAHRCPVCALVCVSQYWGHLPPQYTNHHLKQDEPTYIDGGGI
jgi:hypothetical protein